MKFVMIACTDILKIIIRSKLPTAASSGESAVLYFYGLCKPKLNLCASAHISRNVHKRVACFVLMYRFYVPFYDFFIY